MKAYCTKLIPVVVALLCGIAMAASAQSTDPTAQTASQNLEMLGVIPVAQPLSGLGFNVNPLNEWEFASAAQAGATYVRFQCPWAVVEQQTAPPANKSAGYVMLSDCQTGLNLSKKYGMHPTLIAAFGAPNHTILTVTIPGGAAVGSTSINIQFSSAIGGDTLASIQPILDTFMMAGGQQVTGRHSYSGALVTAVTLQNPTHATITLASALTQSLPANSTTSYWIGEYLYPPAATFSPTDPSVVAYANYANFLARSIAAAGLSGGVEIWNEPPWTDDPWDCRDAFYDNPGPLAGKPDWGFAAALSGSRYSVPGVSYIWSGTNKSGDSSVLDPQMASTTGAAFTQPAVNVLSESFHPYGDNPEDELWNEACLQTNSTNWFACNLDKNSTSNALKAEAESVVQKKQNALWGIGHNITETGFPLSVGDSAHQTRFLLRQFLGYQAVGVTPIEFYRLYDQSGDMTFTDPTTMAPLQALVALSGLLSDLKTMPNAPVASYSLANLSSITSYSGYFPLDIVHIVGSSAGDSMNSEFLGIWQRSHVVNPAVWGQLAQPSAASVTVNIPAGLGVVSVTDLVTRTSVLFTTTGQQVTLLVSDDPIGIIVRPTKNAQVTSISVSPASATMVTGQTLAYNCSATLSNALVVPCPSPAFISSNTSVVAVAHGTASAHNSGVATVSITVAGSGNTFSATSAITVVSNIIPATIKLGALSSTYSGLAQTVSVTTSPAGLNTAVTYNGSSTAPTTAGAYAVVATVSDPAYSAPAAVGTFIINPQSPVLSWIPSKILGWKGDDLSTILTAATTAPGTFTYTATGGGVTIPVTGRSVLPPGNYILSCYFTPADTTNFNSVSTTLSFSVVNHSIVVANGSGTVVSFSSGGSLNNQGSGGGIGAVVDPSGNVWSINANASSLSKFDNNGLLLSSSITGGLSNAKALVVDGGGRIWVANGNGTLIAFTPVGSASSAASVASAGLASPVSISVDAAGSLWIANSTNNTVTEVFGVATPVVTPVVASMPN